MEVAGVVIGALALVGVFEDCITLVSQIGAAKSMNKDYVLLATRLDLQKALLLQWAERMKIYEERYDARLDDPNIASPIYRALDCIRRLLQDGTLLQHRYGVRPADLHEAQECSTAICGRLMSRLRESSMTLRLRCDIPTPGPVQSRVYQQSANNSHTAKRPWNESDFSRPCEGGRLDDSHQNKRLRSDPLLHWSGPSFQAPKDSRKNEFSGFEKMKWVIKDKDQFEALVRTLSSIITDIDKLIPPRRGEDPVNTVLKHEIQQLRDIHELRMIMHSSIADSCNFVDVARETIDRKCTQLVLNRLWFRLIDDRKNNIAEAHSSTLEWVFQPPASEIVWDDLGNWLRSEGNIYWIHGKPGSGKSTLMKFLYGHHKTVSSLQAWAGDRQLTMASFFLWNIGSADQSSQEGLARGLLYHVLEQNPVLTPVILPHMWKEAQCGVIDIKPPSVTELKTAFRELGAGQPTGAFAFFIDGLDEFTGDHREGIAFVKSLASSANIKLLVSSRPIDTCVAAFFSAPKLRVQDLTEPDIAMYIDDTVRKHPYVSRSKCISDTIVEGLMRDIKSKASGVFLWVVLACRTLIEGFVAYDNAKELRRRVDELPPELEDLFRHILASLPSRSLQQAAKLLRVCYTSVSLNAEDSVPAVALAWADENDMQIDALETFAKFAPEATEQKCAVLEGRLRSRCRGILEVHTYPDRDSRVNFMHRTVFEFLNSLEIWKMDCLKIADTRFDPNAILAYMSCYDLFLSPRPVLNWNQTSSSAYYYIRKVEQTSPSYLLGILRRLTFAIMRPRPGRNKFFGPAQEELSLDEAALLLAVEMNLESIVQGHDVRAFNTRKKSRYHDRPRRHDLLYHALEKPILSAWDPQLRHLRPSTIIVEHLMLSGWDPNERLESFEGGFTTLWETWIDSDRGARWCSPDRKALDPEGFHQVINITMIMIRADADISGHEELLGRLSDAWLEQSARQENEQDRERMRFSCDELKRALIANHGDESD